MFGLSDNKQQSDNSTPPAAEPSVAAPETVTQPTEASPPADSPTDSSVLPPPVTTIASEGVTPAPTTGVVTPTAPPMPEVSPAVTDTMPSIPEPEPIVPEPAPAEAPAAEIPPPTESPSPEEPSVNLENAYISTDSPGTNSGDDATKPSAASLMDGNEDEELIKIKQQALQSLSPLVDELEQSPEEKFKTTMMLIQASDNSELVKEAYDAASAIKDDKARAQALLDVVNEINYFTQHQADDKTEA